MKTTQSWRNNLFGEWGEGRGAGTQGDLILYDQNISPPPPPPSVRIDNY